MAREIDARALRDMHEGRREPMIPVYHFGGGQVKYERPDHNPYKNALPEGEEGGDDS